jgi:putative ABC transport system permease protein
MSMLDRKLRRDLWHTRGQILAIGLMMMSGVALFVALRSMNGYLRSSQLSYYERYRFADLFVSLRRAPASLAATLARVPGVAQVETRVVAQVVLDVPGSSELVTGRLVSIPDRPRPMLNALHLVSGGYPTAGPGLQVVISDAFGRANHLDVGDTLAAVINGRRERLRIAARGQSPEYVYEIPGNGAEVLPDSKRFGVLWVRQNQLAAAFDLEGAFNDAVFALERGARPRAVIAAIDRLTAPYGGLGAYERKDQISNQFVSSEIEETRITSVLIPSIFLGVTAFMLYLVTSRLVAMEREQIGVLKAFGYPNRRILGHYAAFVLAPIAGGTVVGTGVGLWFAHLLAGVYANFFQFPAADFHPDLRVVLATFAIAAGAALTGGLAAVRAALRLPPATAMQPPVPPRYRAGLLERMGVLRHFAAPTRIVIRNLERRPVKAGLTILGVALGYAIVVAGWFSFDALDLIETSAFFEADRADLRLGFQELVSGDVRYELAHLPGVNRVELIRAAPVRLRLGHREERTGLIGLSRDSRLRRVVEPPDRVLPIPDAGILLTTVLATKLRAGPGAVLQVEALDGKRRRFEVRVAGIANELIGSGAYVAADRLHRLLGERDVASGALLSVERSRRADLIQALRKVPAVSGLGDRAATRAAFDRTIAESFRISVVMIFVFACLIAAAVVYNSARIALSERARELASLRVLGFTRREVAAMLLGEQAVLTLLAIPAGAALGYFLCWLMATRFTSEIFRLPLVIYPRTYALATAVIVIAALGTGLMIRRRVYRLDLVSVLKARE